MTKKKIIISITVKIVKFSVLKNIPVNIIAMHIKNSMTLKFYGSDIVSNHLSYSDSVE